MNKFEKLSLDVVCKKYKLTDSDLKDFSEWIENTDPKVSLITNVILLIRDDNKDEYMGDNFWKLYHMFGDYYKKIGFDVFPFLEDKTYYYIYLEKKEEYLKKYS